jgi:hypothetical protein
MVSQGETGLSPVENIRNIAIQNCRQDLNRHNKSDEHVRHKIIITCRFTGFFSSLLILILIIWANLLL